MPRGLVVRIDVSNWDKNPILIGDFMNYFVSRIALFLALLSCMSALAEQQVFTAGQMNIAPNVPVALASLTLVFQTDGNFVAYSAGRAVWASNSFASCSSGCVAAFQTDGNLVLYHAGSAFWSSHTYGHPNSQLVVSTTAPYLQIAENGLSLWPIAGLAVTVPPPASTSCPTLNCYFIDSQAGSDANSGNDPSSAWKSLLNLASAAVTPGTSILLRRGSQFSGQITLRFSGTAASPIIVDTYGTGASPVISNSTYGVLGQGVSYISINNLAIDNVSDTGILGAGNGTEYWTVSNCTITNAGTSGIQARPDWNNASPLRGWVVQGNNIGTINTAAVLNYDKAGILLQGTTGALVTRNTVTAVNTSGIRIGSYQSASSQNTTVSYNQTIMNQGGIAVRDTLNATVTHNWIHDGMGYGIGISGSANANGVYSSYNNILTYNLVQNMRKSADGQLYNGFDITSSANGKLYHNTIENIYAHSVSLEGDAGPANHWIVRNNIFDARRQGSGMDGNCFLFRLVNYNSETLSNNLYISNSNWIGVIGTDMDATSDLAIWYTPAWIALGIDTSSLYNQDVAFIDVVDENLGLQANSYARNLGVSIPGIGQVSLDSGALPYGQTSVLAF